VILAALPHAPLRRRDTIRGFIRSAAELPITLRTSWLNLGGAQYNIAVPVLDERAFKASGVSRPISSASGARPLRLWGPTVTVTSRAAAFALANHLSSAADLSASAYDRTVFAARRCVIRLGFSANGNDAVEAYGLKSILSVSLVRSERRRVSTNEGADSSWWTVLI